MSINTNFHTPRITVKHPMTQEELCTVRGITPDDIAFIVCEHAEEVEKVMKTLEDSPAIGEAVAAGETSTAVEALTPSLLNSLIQSVPSLAAKIIAVAADEPSMWGHVQKNFVLPIQFNVLTEIAKLTFIDKNGFKEFLGNVMALLGNVKAPKQGRLELDTSPNGSPG
jgi:hypothetical protein